MILPLAYYGDPVLRAKGVPVEEVTSEIEQLIADMFDTMKKYRGIGLAAPQVHVPKRIVIFFIPAGRDGPEAEEDEGDEEGDDDRGIDLTIMINPKIQLLGEETTLDWEACLSVPGMMGAVPRRAAIRYRWQTLDGETMERQADGFHARAVQHECDHLDGILYPMRMDDLSTLTFTSEISRAREDEEQEDAENG